MRSWKTSWPVAFAALAVAAVLTAVALVNVSGGSGPLPVADGGGTDFFARDVLWAQDSTIHPGDRTYDVSPLLVRTLRPTRHGVFLEAARGRGADVSTSWVFFDGRTSTPVPGHVRDVVVSQDGEKAAWVDLHGPWRPAGRVAQVIVTDLRSGDVVLRSSEGMGGGFGDDLGARYENLQPQALGFDERRFYWLDASDSGTRRRWDLRTHASESAEGSAARGTESGTVPVGEPWNPATGPGTWVSHGRPAAYGEGGATGFFSPDRQFLLTEAIGLLPITRPGSGETVTLTGVDRWTTFGGWQDDTTFFAMTTSHHSDGIDPAEPDRTPARLVSCSLSSLRCTTLRRLVGTSTVVLPGSEKVL